jgi:superfamily II DNA or RNA helicase
MCVICFKDGTLILENWEREEDPPFFRRDPRTKEWRSLAIYYRRILNEFKKERIVFQDKAKDFINLDIDMKLSFELYSHQSEALEAWRKHCCGGSVVLPTGSGKSLVGLEAINFLKVSTLVVSPTLDLMNQWYDRITDAFGIEIGILGGGYHEIRPITVTTYDSAYRHIDRYGNRFGLLVFDEIHHLPAPSYSQIPELSLAPYRLGLTATYRRADAKHQELTYLIGPVVYEKRIKDLKEKHLSDYEIHRFSVSLTPEEKKEYDRKEKVYYDYVKEKKVRFYGRKWEDFIKESSYNPNARKALLARKEIRQYLFAAKEKLNVLESLLKQHKKDQVIIFTQNNDFVYTISKRYLIPAITHRTKTEERKAILDRFRNKEYRFIVTSKVLNEGVDIPAANVAVILSGSANPMEYLQRLGRILRKRSKKKAFLYEIIVKGTQETSISYRRRDSDAYR